VTITIYDLTGKEIAKPVNEFKSTGNYDVVFNSANLSSGVYFYSLKTNEFSDTKKMIVIK
jgi:hypothetical protein